MRLKEDSSSWHASGLQVRDARHDASSPEVAPHSAKKDCKKWCRGKVGRHHVGKWKSYDEVNHRQQQGRDYYQNWRVLVCERCQRQLDNCWSWNGRRCTAQNHGHAVPVA